MQSTRLNNLTDQEVEQLLVHREWLIRMVASLIKDPVEAEDIASEVMEGVLQSPPRRRSSLRAFLLKTARNKSLNYLRDPRRQTIKGGYGEDNSQQIPEEPYLEKAEAQMLVGRAVMDLEAKYRSPIILRYFEDHSFEEIAHKLGTTPVTVRKQISRGLQKIRERLSKHREDWSLYLAILFKKELRPIRQYPTKGSTGSGFKLSILPIALISIVAILYIAFQYQFSKPSEKNLSVINRAVVAPNTVKSAPQTINNERVLEGSSSSFYGFQGRVEDLNGNEVAGVTVIAQSGSSQVQTATNEQGEYSLAWPHQNWSKFSGRIYVSSDKYNATISNARPAQPATNVHFKVTDTGVPVYVKLVDSATELPIPGERIIFRGNGWHSNQTTNSQGVATFQAPNGGEFSIGHFARPNGSVLFSPIDISVDPASTEISRTIEVHFVAQQVNIEFHSSSGQENISTIDFFEMLPGKKLRRDTFPIFQTENPTQIRIRPRKTEVLLASAARHFPIQLSTARDERENTKVELTKIEWIPATFFRGSKPAASLQVIYEYECMQEELFERDSASTSRIFIQSEAVTNASGQLFLPQLHPSQNHGLSLSVLENGLQRSIGTFDLQEIDTYPIHFQIQPKLKVHQVQVIDGDKNILSDIPIRIEVSPSSDAGQTYRYLMFDKKSIWNTTTKGYTDTNGFFELKTFPHCTLDWEIDFGGGAYSGTSRLDRESSPDKWVIQLPTSNFTVSGRIEAPPTGSAFENLFIKIGSSISSEHSNMTDIRFTSQSTVEADGSFHFTGLPVGEYKIYVLSESSSLFQCTYLDSQDDVVISLPINQLTSFVFNHSSDLTSGKKAQVLLVDSLGAQRGHEIINLTSNRPIANIPESDKWIVIKGEGLATWAYEIARPIPEAILVNVEPGRTLNIAAPAHWLEATVPLELKRLDLKKDDPRQAAIRIREDRLQIKGAPVTEFQIQAYDSEQTPVGDPFVVQAANP